MEPLSERRVNSHPCRRALASLHNGKTIIAELVDRTNHSGKIDADKGDVDPAYVALMEASIFAFVPRGDAEFSYRLLEAMSFGCIPIILSDGLVLPFDRLISWADISLHMPESRLSEIPAFLAQVSPERIAEMQAGVQRVYQQHFVDIQQIAAALIDEVTLGLLLPQTAATSTTPRHVTAALIENIKVNLPQASEKAQSRTGSAWNSATAIKKQFLRALNLKSTQASVSQTIFY